MVDFEYLDHIEQPVRTPEAGYASAAGDRAEAAFHRGRGLYLAGRFPESLAAYEEAVSASPRFLRAQAAQIDALLQMRLIAQAESQAESLLERHNRNTDIGVARARCYLFRSRRRAGRGKPDSAEFHYELARKFCDIALATRPDSSYAWLRKGEVNLARRHRLAVGMARECFENARREDPGWELLVEIGMIAYDWGWHREAEAWLTEAGAVAMDQAGLWHWLGLVRLALGEKLNARGCLEKALSLDPTHAQAEQALLACSPGLRVARFLSRRRRLHPDAKEHGPC